jgi:GntR family transcriptional repressor for pyruvate dehydrogenase complex
VDAALPPPSTGASASARRWRKPPRLYEEVARTLAEAIAGGQYAPGEFLPTEQALADEYGASRNVIREALKVLTTRGLVEVLHGSGTRVLPRARWQLLDQLVVLMRADASIPQSLLELRRILETEIAALAAERATGEQVEALRAAIDAMRGAADRPETFIEHGIQFHRLLAEASGNVLLPMVLEPVERLLRASRLATVQAPGAIQRAIETHNRVLDAVAAHDPAGARLAMQRHLAAVEDEMALIHQRPDGAGGVDRS